MIGPWTIDLDGWSPSKQKVDALLRVALGVCCDHEELRAAVEAVVPLLLPLAGVSFPAPRPTLRSMELDALARHRRIKRLHAVIFAVVREHIVQQRDSGGTLQWWCRHADADKLRERLVSEYRGPE